MPAYVNLRLLQKEPAHLEGDLPVAEFGADLRDELMRFTAPLSYEVDVERHPDGLLVTGTLRTTLSCNCSRCLKPFDLPLHLDSFTALVPLTGDEALRVEGDFGDLTPLLREDIYLALPTNPLCRPECRGLPEKDVARDSRLEGVPSEDRSPWAALDQLKL
jgi:uncharacterized protein